MFKSLLRDRKLVFLVLLFLLIKLFSLNETYVEHYYTYGVYPFISNVLRALLGWIPFSVGDLLYFAAGLYLGIKVWKYMGLLAKRQIKEFLSWVLVRKLLKLILLIYVVFNVFWGLNYNRQGIAAQLNLQVQSTSAEDLSELVNVLQQRLCFYGDKSDSIERLSLNNNSFLFKEGIKAYHKAAEEYSFLTYKFPSIKASLFTPFGHYFGFTGYYNPFSAEAQIKTTVPVFIKPFVLCHEIAHQLGYAKENEANLVSFLVGRSSDNLEFRYSVYYDMFLYAMNEMLRSDPKLAYLIMQTAHPQFRKDYEAYYGYILSNKNNIEPFVNRFYDNYLKLNNQPKGNRTYSQVTTWLIAYMKKYGVEAI